MRIADTAMAMTFAALLSTNAACSTSIDRSLAKTPGGMIALQPLERSQYRIVGPTKGKATVNYKATVGQEGMFSFLFGDPQFSDDYVDASGKVKEMVGTRNGYSLDGQSAQLDNLFSRLSFFQGPRAKAEGHALAAAYFRAIESVPGTDLLLEPTVMINSREDDSYFGTHTVAVTVTVTGKAISFITDAEKAPPAPKADAPSPAAAEPTLSIEKHAALHVDIDQHPEQAPEILNRYGLTAEQHGQLESKWVAQVAQNPSLATTWLQAMSQYRESLTRRR